MTAAGLCEIRRMTSAEIRGATLAYHQIRELLNQPLPESTRALFAEYLRSVEDQCKVATNNSAPARWARTVVGPVLAAAVGAATWMRDDVPTLVAALRIFGLFGDPPMSNQAAWELMRAYLSEATLTADALAEVRRQSGLRLIFPCDPTPAEVLEELTRQRGGAFPTQVAHWLAEYFRNHAEDDNPFGGIYRTTLADLMANNVSGQLAQIASPAFIHGRLRKEDWEALAQGRVPQARLEFRAGLAAARQFITEYWQRWNPRPPLAE